MSGKLYIVPTPIGNLKDITLRALEVLKSVDLILAEDTRTSRILLKHYDITTPCFSYHQHNEHKTTSKWMKEMLDGKNIALISDAGTPGISDPGYLIIKQCLENDLSVEVLPGATAFIPALLLSGFSNHEFVFVGFLPAKKGRKSKIQEIASEQRTVVLYESPHKLISLLKDLSNVSVSPRKISISRELTKKFEETFRGTILEAVEFFTQKPPKGEFVVVLEGKSSATF